MMVVFSHSFPVSGQSEPTYFFMSFGMLAVHGFFIISGYLIVQSFGRSSTVSTFAWHRFLRIVPALVVAIVFSQAMLVLSNGYKGNPMILFNASLWTLPWEAVCYVTVAAVGVAGALSLGAFPALFCCLWFIYIMRLGDNSPSFWFVTTMMMMFLMGAFAAISEARISMPRTAFAGIIMLTVIFTTAGMQALQWILTSAQFAYGPNFPLGGIRQALYVAALPFVVLYLAVYARPIPFFKSDLSYGIYLYAWPLQEGVVKCLHHYGFALGGWTVFAITILPLLVISWLSWHLVEKPMLKLKNIRMPKVMPGQPTVPS